MIIKCTEEQKQAKLIEFCPWDIKRVEGGIIDKETCFDCTISICEKCFKKYGIVFEVGC